MEINITFLNGPEIKIDPQVGPQGSQGIQGPPGETGPQGPKGEKGDTGEQGPQGEVGPKGDKGDTGEQGPKGDQGAVGPQGPQGIQGIQGPKGEKGDTGEQGPKGDTGEAGPQGVQGIQGSKGDKGDPGEQGPKGDKGDPGDVSLEEFNDLKSDLVNTKDDIENKLQSIADFADNLYDPNDPDVFNGRIGSSGNQVSDNNLLTTGFIEAKNGTTFYFTRKNTTSGLRVGTGAKYVYLYTMSKEMIGIPIAVSNITSYTVSESSIAYIRFTFASSDVDLMVSTKLTANYDKESTAVDKIARTNISNISNEFYYKYNILFEQGGISSSGALNDYTTRIRTKDYIPVELIHSADVDSAFIFYVNEYDASHANLRQLSPGSHIDSTTFSSDTVYVRLVVRYDAANVDITTSTDTGFELITSTTRIGKYDNKRVDKIENDIGTGLKNRSFSAFKRYDYVLDYTMDGLSDCTIVDDMFLAFSAGSDDLEENGSIKVVTFGNGFDKPRTGITTMYHRLGHCNTVDYNPENDCLILGNGSGSYTLAGKIIIIPGFKAIVESGDYNEPDTPLTLSNSNAIVIDCSSYNLGTKFNVIWGERNLTENNIAYLITAKYGTTKPNIDGGDNGTIRRILLGMGTNQLEYGSYTAAEADEFNGTFKIVDTYTQPGTTYQNANQGSCFFGGKIYCCVGHDGEWVWVMDLDRNGNRIWYDEYKQKSFAQDGSVIGSNRANTTGICYHDGYFYIGMGQIGVVAIKEF